MVGLLGESGETHPRLFAGTGIGDKLMAKIIRKNVRILVLLADKEIVDRAAVLEEILVIKAMADNRKDLAAALLTEQLPIMSVE